MPKSSTFTVKRPAPARRDRARNTFSGLRSRCTTPAACAAAIAWQSCSNTSRTSSCDSGPFVSTRARRSSPSSSSITRYGRPLSASMPAASTSTTCSLAMRAPTRASCSKRRWSDASATISRCITLSARGLPVLRWSTR